MVWPRSNSRDQGRPVARIDLPLIVDLADVEAVTEDATLPFCGLLANGNTIERQTQRQDSPKITLGAFLATLMNETGNLELI
jgi:hypothetical protein